jgi:hypothetical protein
MVADATTGRNAMVSASYILMAIVVALMVLSFYRFQFAREFLRVRISDQRYSLMEDYKSPGCRISTAHFPRSEMHPIIEEWGWRGGEEQSVSSEVVVVCLKSFEERSQAVVSENPRQYARLLAPHPRIHQRRGVQYDNPIVFPG